jgi:GTP-binding protein EngB required for normal cell division
LIVATKSDKLSNNELRQNNERIARVFRTDRVLSYSATKKRGREELWGAIEKSLKS